MNLIKNDGTPIVCSISATSVKDVNGKVIHYDGVIEDITDRVKSELALKASEEKYRVLFEKSDDAILIITNEKFVDCNSATIKMLRYKDKK